MVKEGRLDEDTEPGRGEGSDGLYQRSDWRKIGTL